MHPVLYLKKKMATHSSILAWKISWTEEPGSLQSMGLQRVRRDWATEHWALSIVMKLTFLLFLKLLNELYVTCTFYIGNFKNWFVGDHCKFNEAGHSKLVLWDNPEGWGGGWRWERGSGWGDMCAPVADLCCCMAKATTILWNGGGLVTKLCPTLVIPWIVARQAPLSMGPSRQEYWRGLPFPSPIL